MTATLNPYGLDASIYREAARILHDEENVVSCWNAIYHACAARQVPALKLRYAETFYNLFDFTRTHWNEAPRPGFRVMALLLAAEVIESEKGDAHGKRR